MNNGFIRELWAILTLYLSTLLTGYGIGYAAVAVPDMKAEIKSNQSLSFLPQLEASNDELTWFASNINLGQIFGCLLGGYLGGRIGPKRTILVVSPVGMVTWLVITFSPHILPLLIARFALGIVASFSTALCSLLVVQFSSLKWRGGFLSLYILMFGIGILLSYCMGAVLYWRYSAAIPCLLYLFLFIGLFRIPESPIWLLGHKGREDARKALQWLRNSDHIEEELEDLEKLMEDQGKGLSTKEALKNLSRYDIRTPFLLITANFWIVMFSGPAIVVFYSVEIFQNTGTGINHYLASVLVGSINVFGGIIGMFLIQKFPRVKLNMFMMTAMAVMMATLGTAVYFKDNGYEDSSALDITQVLAVVVYMFCFGAGTGPLLMVYLGELLPSEYKVLSGIINSLANVPIFVLTLIFPTLKELLTPAVTYWIFAFFGLISNIFYFFFMPETRGKTPLEIKEIFLKKTRK